MQSATLLGLACAALASTMLLGCTTGPDAGPIAPPSRQGDIIDGTADLKDEATVFVLVQDDIQNPTWQGHCSGTVVAPHVVLTAAHCLAPEVTGFDTVYVAIFTGDDIDDPAQGNDVGHFRFEVSHAYDPAFDGTQPLGDSHDVGVIVTDDSFEATPIAMNRLDPPEVGTSLRLVGFGRSDSSNEDVFGARLSVDADVAGTEPSHIYFQDAGMCGGDSGGPSFWKRGDDAFVAGIHSYIEHIDSCTGKGYDLAVTDAVTAFVNPYIEDADPGFLDSLPDQHAEGTGGSDAGGGDAASTGATTTATTATATTDAASGTGGGSSSSGGAGGIGGSDDTGDDAADDGCAVASLGADATPHAWGAIIALAAIAFGLRRRRAG